MTGENYTAQATIAGESCYKGRAGNTVDAVPGPDRNDEVTSHGS